MPSSDDMEKLAPGETRDYESMQENEASLCLMMRPNEGMQAHDAKRHGRVRPHKKAEIPRCILNKQNGNSNSIRKRNATLLFFL